MGHIKLDKKFTKETTSPIIFLKINTKFQLIFNSIVIRFFFPLNLIIFNNKQNYYNEIHLKQIRII